MIIVFVGEIMGLVWKMFKSVKNDLEFRGFFGDCFWYRNLESGKYVG